MNGVCPLSEGRIKGGGEFKNCRSKQGSDCNIFLKMYTGEFELKGAEVDINQCNQMDK